MPEEFGEDLIRDQRPFLLLFSSPHLFSEDRDSHDKRLMLCSVAHSYVYFIGLLSGWKIKTWPIIRFLTESVTYNFFLINQCWEGYFVWTT